MYVGHIDIQAAKFLDASGNTQDYHRYAENLFDIIIAGGLLGTITKCIFLICP